MAKLHVMSGSGYCSTENLGSLTLSVFCGVVLPVCLYIHMCVFVYMCVNIYKILWFCSYKCIEFTMYLNTLEITEN